MASRSKNSLYGHREPRVSLAQTQTSVERAYSASDWGEFMRIGSSNQVGVYGASALAIFLAVGRFHRLWNSTRISIRSPTALRIFSKGAIAAFICSALMQRPPVSCAAGSNG